MLELHGSSEIKVWAYSYEILPPQALDRLTRTLQVLEDGHSAAGLAGRKWEGRLVTDDLVTHILVVSDSPDQQREVNRRLEAELRKVGAGFSMTLPLAVR
jgi:hypothetical protein